MQSLLRLARRAGGRRLTSARRPRRPIVSTASGRHFAQHRFLSTLFNVAPVRGAAIRRASIRGPEGYGRPLAANFSTDGSPDGSGSAGDKADEAAASDTGSDGGVTGGSSELETDTDGDVSAAKESEWNRTGGSDDIVVDGDDNEESKAHVEDMKPREVIEELNRNIVGQMDAKRAVAIALRNRWRRQQLPEHMRREIVPRNMLMIGPTGCGKTEIARRLSQLMDAPFVKVEATKFTEVGFHGRDVDTIIRDLLENGIALTKKTRRKRLKEQVTQTVETKILEALMGRESVKSNEHISYLKFLRDGKLDDQKVDIHVPVKQRDIGPGGFAIDPSTLQGGSLDALVGRVTKAMTGPKTVKRNLKIKEARALLEEAEMEELLEADDVVAEAIRNVEQNGIVFIDEIDKICTPSGEARFSGDASSEGVQRDLLPLVEGSSCSTKHGNVNTDYILFIASGVGLRCSWLQRLCLPHSALLLHDLHLALTWTYVLLCCRRSTTANRPTCFQNSKDVCPFAST